MPTAYFAHPHSSPLVSFGCADPLRTRGSCGWSLPTTLPSMGKRYIVTSIVRTHFTSCLVLLLQYGKRRSRSFPFPVFIFPYTPCYTTNISSLHPFSYVFDIVPRTPLLHTYPYLIPKPPPASNRTTIVHGTNEGFPCLALPWRQRFPPYTFPSWKLPLLLLRQEILVTNSLANERRRGATLPDTYTESPDTRPPRAGEAALKVTHSRSSVTASRGQHSAVSTPLPSSKDRPVCCFAKISERAEQRNERARDTENSHAHPGPGLEETPSPTSCLHTTDVSGHTQNNT